MSPDLKKPWCLDCHFEHCLSGQMQFREIVLHIVVRLRWPTVRGCEILVPAAEAVLILSAGGRTEAPAGLVTQIANLKAVSRHSRYRWTLQIYLYQLKLNCRFVGIIFTL